MRALTIEGIRFEIAFDYALYIAGGVLLLALLILLYIRKIRKETKKLKDVQKWLDKIRAQPNFDQKMTAVLEAVSRQYEANSYAIYIRDERFDKLMLRASRFRSGKGGGESGGTIVPSQIDAYKPPATASKLFLTKSIEVVKEGEVPLLVVPISERGILRMGPVPRISGRAKRKLRQWIDFVKPMVDEVIEAEQIKEQASIAKASKNAIVSISKIALEEHKALEQILPFCLNTLKGSGGCLVQADDRSLEVQATAGARAALGDRLASDEAALRALQARAEANEIQYVRDDVPAYFREAGIQDIVLVSLGTHFFAFWGEQLQERVWMNLFLRTLAHNYRTFAKAQGAYLRGTGAYIPLLQSLARLLDDLSPNSIGYSEQMSRYSIVIARELGMSPAEIRDVAVAAYLSHIGTIALSSDLFQKEGQYTEAEFELMKLHAEVSALIVAFATGNERAASYIRHHHERMDGHGYPAGLKGEEIPVGARIIAVVQTFLAKVNGRNYRDPLSFNQSLQTLRSASGSQLDSDLVDVFVHWYTDKRRENIDTGRTLGSCSEMCCVPETICGSCPAYGREDINCWETDGVHCIAHGKSCDSCFVKTEALSRRGLGVSGASPT